MKLQQTASLLIRSLIVSLAWLSTVTAHHVITYPGTRGNNLITNETFPFGMQWSYPCGGLGPTTNRSFYPLTGGAFAVQPGWFRGHSESLWYINLCLEAEPRNCSLPITSVFRVRGPVGDNPFPGTFCLPYLPLPAGLGLKAGDRASIQAVQTHVHGAPAYSCADVEFTDDSSKVPPVTASNCFNSTNLVVEHVQIVGSSAEIPISDNSSRTAGSPAADSSKAPSNTAEKRSISRLSGLLGLAALL
ncbi:hypothetical protein MCOR27_008561 [Pyricularia oryzae]|uniref:Copper acquisition factor BIM1-like domain-containing protein n=2 Tax=Pyricularia TaxID=48558 RepID=A0ABQ8NBP6_PYRGI|nr:hypothetical protein MCOR01_004864 [Pyricularia oryzae]KAI6293978.1 hypothetical protein MCOR33_008780 [Pyricularia grisea]KAH9431607.1 hypothetical protein MCOR02_008897 [Pyricularia oryzae]KAI6255286.1 hypothetical protein MCOR19_008204 [Pyricularia oryzae]KAI6269576.1 hypothetical protein MCOR26_008652 [Pyricularia oryzae]